jgi:hypothetical protein
LNPSTKILLLHIEKLQQTHKVDAFDSGSEALNRFLSRYALQNQRANASQTYVALEDTEVVGHYTLVYAQVEYGAAPERLIKGPRTPPSSCNAFGTPCGGHKLAGTEDWQRTVEGRSAAHSSGR